MTLKNIKPKKSAPYAIHWFRRDLRLEGNLILQNQLERYQGRVIGVFCFDKKFLSRPDFSAHRFLFFLKTLKQLQEQIESLGGYLIVMDHAPDDSFQKIISELTSFYGSAPESVSWNRDYEPFAIKRDVRMEALFQQWNVSVSTDRDHLLIEPNELVRQGGGFYQIFTPFRNQWLKLFETPEIQSRIRSTKEGLRTAPRAFSIPLPESHGVLNSHLLDTYLDQTQKQVRLPVPKVGHDHAVAQAVHFKKSKHADYKIKRDIPSVAGTSQLSIYLKNGTITVPQLIALFDLKSGGPKNNDTYFNELIWREFYYHILAHFPYVESGAFQKKYDALAWENNDKYFEAWKQGKTGYPIVDAGMRQLLQTGWMHNRIRMIVASFLTKDLLIDWRWGERYFMETLLDGDLAPNNGGWQWAASTGCDAQPYFRIFNPQLQGERFDPDGNYVLRYVPELKKFTGSRDFHAAKDPIVIHADQKNKVLDLFKKVRSDDEC